MNLIPNIDVAVDINSLAPVFIDHILHVNDTNSRMFSITLYANNQKISLYSGNFTAKAAISVNNILLDDDVTALIQTDSTVAVTVDNKYLTLIPGVMKIQLTITGGTGGTDVIVTPLPILARVTSDLAQTAQILPNSHSSYSEIVAEIVAARGDYDNLAQALSHLMGFLSSETVSNATETGKVYYTTVGSSKALIVPVSGNSSQVQFRLDRDGKIYSRRREKRNGAYPEWGSFADIAAGVDPEVVRQIVENYISEQGIAEAVEDYLDANPTMVLKYDTVSEMLEAGLTVDHIIVTAGYHAPNDGGGAMYRIVESTDRFAETLENGLKAELIIEGGCKNARQFGACGDNITDDTAALQAWLNDVAVNGGYAYLPKGHYVITAPITIDWSHNGDLRRNFLQKIVGDGCTSYETGYDNSVIIASGASGNFTANRGALEFISDGNTWGTQVQISDIGIYCDSACDPMSFCLFYGDSRHLALNRVKMKGYNDILVRCGSKVTEGVVSSSYEHICCTIEHCDLITRGTKGFAVLPESVLVQNAYSMLDTLSLRDSFIGGVFAVHCNNLSVESCTVTIEGIKNRLITDDNVGKLNGYQIDYATGFLIIETASTIIKNTYFEDFKRGIDVAPICGNIRSVLIEGCYFNPGSNQYDNNNQLIKSDYGIWIRPGKSGTQVAHVEVSHNVFRHDETLLNKVKFNVAAVQNDKAEDIIVYANAGRPNSNADQIYSTYGVSAIDSVFTNDMENLLLSMPTKVSDLTNDSGFLTLSTLPIYNGGVQ